jgi:hypothetical protein
MTTECVPVTLELVQELRKIAPRVTIIAGGPAALEHSDDLINAGCYQICASSNEARRAVRRYMLQRAKKRISAASRPSPRRYAQNG